MVLQKGLVMQQGLFREGKACGLMTQKDQNGIQLVMPSDFENNQDLATHLENLVLQHLELHSQFLVKFNQFISVSGYKEFYAQLLESNLSFYLRTNKLGPSYLSVLDFHYRKLPPLALDPKFRIQDIFSEDAREWKEESASNLVQYID